MTSQNLTIYFTNEDFENCLLYDLGYRQDAGFKKGWYKIVYKEDMRNLTSEELETKCLGVLFCTTDKNEILKDLKNKLIS